MRLIDFGTAEFCAKDKFRHALVGTRQYRAPEVVFGSGWNHTLDVWAVGCVAAEMLCGRQLFPAVSLNDSHGCPKWTSTFPYPKPFHFFQFNAVRFDLFPAPRRRP